MTVRSSGAGSVPLLEIVVTTCCGRDVSWIGQLFSTVGWQHQAYQSPISLPRTLNQHAALLVYDKGGNASSKRSILGRVKASMAYPSVARSIALPNANGREAHTIAHHIAANYDRLAALTTFLQGDAPAKHFRPVLILNHALQAAAHAGDEEAIVRQVVREMHRALPSTSAASLCQVVSMPPLMCETNRNNGARDWPCPATHPHAAYYARSGLFRAEMSMGGYTGLAAFIMRWFLREPTWPGMPVPWCDGGSLSVTASQARAGKPQEWWEALRTLLDQDRKIKWVSALRMAHVLERLWLRIFTQPIDLPPGAPLDLPQCLRRRNASCCVQHTECCCPTARGPLEQYNHVRAIAGP